MKFNLERYDRVIWRTNGTLILLTCIGTIIFLGLVGFKVGEEMMGTRHKYNQVNVDNKTQKKETLSLQTFEILKGTSLVLVPLSSNQKYDVSYYSKTSESRARNFLIFDNRDKSSVWIWPTNEGLVLDEDKIYDQVSNVETQKVVGLSVVYVDQDSNADQVLDGNDEKSILFFDLQQKKPFSIAEKVDLLVGVRQTSRDEVVFLYSRSDASFFRSLNLNSRTVSDESPIKLP